MLVEELGEPEAGAGGELFFDGDPVARGVGRDSGSLGDLDFQGVSEVGVGEEALAGGDVHDFDPEECLGEVGSGLGGEGVSGDEGVDDDVRADGLAELGDGHPAGVVFFGRGADDPARVEHVGEDAFLEEGAGRDFGHGVAESALGDFAGGVVYEDDGFGVFGEGVDGLDLFGAVDGVGDGCDDVAPADEGEGEEGEREDDGACVVHGGVSYRSVISTG